MARKALILLVIVLMLSLTAMACSVSSDGEKTAVMSEPSTAPSAEPTEALTEKPSEAPTEKPTATPSEVPTAVPTEKPTETPTKKPTEKPTSVPVYTPEPTEAAYVVRCTDQNGNPVSGVVITFCTDSICAPVRTQEGGTASFKGVPYPYEVHVASVPSGYTLSGSDTLTAPHWGGSLSFTFVKAEPSD